MPLCLKDDENNTVLISTESKYFDVPFVPHTFVAVHVLSLIMRAMFFFFMLMHGVVEVVLMGV